MTARARRSDESFEDYRSTLKVEDHDLKLRLKLGPVLYKAYEKYMKTMMINLDEDNDAKPDINTSNRRDFTKPWEHARGLQTPVRSYLQIKGRGRLGKQKRTKAVSKRSS